MSAHQRYLEAPYAAAAAMQTAYEQFLESEDIDEADYGQAELDRMFEEWVEDVDESRREEAAENRADLDRWDDC